MRSSLSRVLRAWFSACAVMIVLFVSATADAAGLGRMTVLSALGQPLNAEIELNATKEELSTMQVRIANAEAYRRAKLEYTPFVASVRLNIEQRRDGGMIVRATTPRAVNDPFIELMVELVWSSGRLIREYTSLIDPPGFTVADSISPPVVSPAVPPVASPKPATVDGRPLLTEPLAPVAPPASPAVATAAVPPSPARPAAAPPAPPASDSYGPVRSGETLSRIAESVRPAGVSLDQMLVSLFRENKGAFDASNMNRLRTGVVLRVPDAAAAGAVTGGEASREIRAQAADFNAYRQRLAGAVQDAPPVAEGGPTASGRIAAKVEDKAPSPAAGSDVLRLSKGDAAAAAAGGRDAKTAAAAREEDATARDKALREANDRVASLEKMLKDAQRLLEIQSRQLSELQKLAKIDPAASAVPEPVKPAPVVPAPVTAPAVADTATAAPAPAPAPVPDAAVPETASSPPVAEARPPVEAPKPVAPPPPAVPSLLDQVLAFVTTYALELGGGLVALLGLGALAARMKNRKSATAVAAKTRTKARATDEPVMAGAAAATAGTAGAVAAGDSLFDSTMESPARVPGASEDEVDPLAEADVYLTYGRDAQAEAILREAIARTPSRHELHLKLLEIYSRRSDARSFEAVATDLFAATGGQGEQWMKAAEMGAQIDPSNPLYAAAVQSPDRFDPTATLDTGRSGGLGGVGTTAAAAATAAAAVAAATAAATAATMAEAVKTTVMGATAETERTQILTVSDTRPAAPESVDFDFEPVQSGTAASNYDDQGTVLDIGGSPDGSTALTATDMDFTLDFGPPGTQSVPELPDLPLEPSRDATATAEADLMFEPVVNIESDSTNVIDPMFQSQATNVLLDSGPPTGSILDFKMDAARAEAEEAGSLTMAGAGQPTLPPMSQETMIMANPDELVTFDMTHPAGLPQNWQETTLPRVDLDLGDTGPDGRNPNKDEHWNDVNTKYDLAKAYEEMGDKDGAREILREVIGEGDDQQKADAESMLVRLG